MKKIKIHLCFGNLTLISYAEVPEYLSKGEINDLLAENKVPHDYWTFANFNDEQEAFEIEKGASQDNAED